MEQWFFTKDGQQEGPVTPQQIRALANAGQLDLATTLVWQEGLDDWKSLEESGLFASDSLSVPSSAHSPTTGSPYLAPAQIRREFSVNIEYPGYGRLRYFLTSMVVAVIAYAIMFAVIFAMLSGGSDGIGAGGASLIILALAVIAVSFYIAYQRVQNLGMSGWAILWLLVPIISMWMTWRMVACPPGYEYHRTLDTAGKVISGIFAGFIALAFIVNIIAAVAQS
jgi:uncharacterized membrane protein YhaH (DUF805 family)